MSVLDYIAARAPQYLDDAALATLIPLATTKFGTAMQSVLQEAVALLCLHWLALRDRQLKDGGAAGSVQMLQEGSLRVQYLTDFTLAKEQPGLSQTVWGMELLQLRKGQIFAPMTRMSV